MTTVLTPKIRKTLDITPITPPSTLIKATGLVHEQDETEE